MHIPINNHHPFKAIDVAGIMCGDDSIIKYAKAQGLIAHGMVSWRTQQCIGIMYMSLYNSTDRIEGSPGGIERCSKRPGAQHRLLVDTAPGCLEHLARYLGTASHQSAHASNIFVRMIGRNFIFSCGPRLYWQHLSCQARAIKKLFNTLCDERRRRMGYR